MIQNGQSLEKEFENGLIKDYEDLLQIAKSKQDGQKMNKLEKQLEDIEKKE